VDGRGGEKSFGHAKLGVRLLEKSQLINKLGAESGDLANYSIQIVSLLPSDDYLLVQRFPGFAALPCRWWADGGLA
jgi:hypothetical protein